jgi:hypothetical protein
VFGASARIGLRLQQVVEAFIAEPLDFRCRKRRSEQNLGDELEGGRQPIGWHFDADAQRVPASVRME